MFVYKHLASAMFSHWRKCNLDKSNLVLQTKDMRKFSRNFKNGNLLKGEYDAIFVDEAQDLSPDQANCLRSLLKEDTNCAMFAGDGAQNIFNKKIKTWKEHGFAFHGRSSKGEFSINYRNTKEIYQFAYQFLRTVIEKFKALNPSKEETEYYKNIAFKRNGLSVNLWNLNQKMKNMTL